MYGNRNYPSLEKILEGLEAHEVDGEVRHFIDAAFLLRTLPEYERDVINFCVLNLCELQS